jgi:hypothetical protein
MSSWLIQYFVSVHRYALAGRFSRLGSAKTNKAEAAKLRGNGDMEGNAVEAVSEVNLHLRLQNNVLKTLKKTPPSKDTQKRFEWVSKL